MCIAIVKPKDKVIPKEVLRTCAEANPDGMGFAYCKDNTVYIRKFLNDFERFYEEYSKVETTSPMLIHFRIATHGEVCVDNCHPFKLNSRMALIHNGVISGYGDKQKKSDTVDFIDKVIGKISHKAWKNEAFRTLVGEAIGYSKFGILDTEGNTYIINENKGYWDDGVWYSNKSYKPKTYNSNKNQGYIVDDKDYDYDYNYKSIYKCSSCHNEFTYNGYSYMAQCPHCHKVSSDNIGYECKGKKYYFDDYRDKKYDYDESWYGCYA